MLTRMKNLVRSMARRLPRPWRNFLKSPGQSLRWWRLSRQPDVVYAPAEAGCSFRCPPLAIDCAFRHQFTDPEQRAEFAEFLALVPAQGSPLLFDLGTHFGLFTHVFLARTGPQARVVGVDPSGVACEMVRRIAAQNGFAGRLDMVQAAVGGREGEIEMVDGGVMLAGYFMAASDQPVGDRIRLPQVTLDALTRRAGRLPDLVKVDVESFELEMLDGAEETLGRGAMPLCLEIHGRYLRDRGADPREVLRKLDRLGYRRRTCGGAPISDEEVAGRDLVRIVARKG